MKYFQQFETQLREQRAIEKHFNNVKFTNFASFVSALELEGLIEESVVSSFDGNRFVWANKIGSGGIQLSTTENPLTNRHKASTLSLKGDKRVVELAESILKRHASVSGISETTIEPEDVEVKVSYNTKLNPLLWDDKQLKQKALDSFNSIARAFVDYLKVDGLEVDDIIITGSNANYNWTEDSDIDLHIVIDMKQATKKYGELTPLYFEAKSKLWNETHDIKYIQHPVELYIQDKDEPHTSTGMFSVKNNQWITEPKQEQPSIDNSSIKQKAAKFINEINELIEAGNTCNPVKAKALMEKIRKYRKTGLSKGGEYSTENLVFKTLRREGYLEKLHDCIGGGLDKSLSVEEEEWWKQEK